MGVEYKLLSAINSPQDVKKLSLDELPELCSELRAFMLEVLSQIPGHLGASLGAVELAVALHYVFDSPTDKLVWDVGHQAYAHKLLTGRLATFKTLRQWGGISGFTHPSESVHDAFIAGHASNSISAALGMAVSDSLQGGNNHVVAVIGDGAMTGGLAYEGLNNAASQANNLLIILNDNHISIDPITGGLSNYLTRILTSKTYNNVRNKGYKGLKRLHLMNDHRRDNLQRFNNSVKALISDDSNFFDSFSIRYFGPIDGHDVKRLVYRLQQIKDFKGPKLLHLKTEKGKGYAPAEHDAVVWHAPGRFDLDTGKREVAPESKEKPMKFQDIFGLTLLELAELDERIVGVTPAMVSGSSFNYMLDRYPSRVFDVGIAEAHAVTFSAGLAKTGSIPFCTIYSSFLQRAYDQVIHDVAMQGAKVIFCLDRSGLVGNDGMTHHGAYDIAALRTIPELTMMSPFDEWELRQMMYTAYKQVDKAPFVIRYPRGAGSNIEWRKPFEELPIGKAEIRKEGEKVVVLSYGPIGFTAQRAIERCEANDGYKVGLINLRFAKPLDTEVLDYVATHYEQVVTIEDGSLAGGVGSAVLEYFSDSGYRKPIKRLGISDEYIKHGEVSMQMEYCGLDEETVYNTLMNILS